jgi:hypothetical protein
LFPTALGFVPHQLYGDPARREEFVTQFQNTLRKLRQVYPILIQRLETHLAANIAGTEPKFSAYKQALSDRFASLTPALLPASLRTFHQRLRSLLDDREAWLSSMANNLIGKNLLDFADDDEERFNQAFSKQVNALNNYSDLAKANVNPEVEDAFRMTFTLPGEQEVMRIIRQPKKRSKDADKAEAAISEQLSKVDNSTALTILARLLKSQLSHE